MGRTDWKGWGVRVDWEIGKWVGNKHLQEEEEEETYEIFIDQALKDQ